MHSTIPLSPITTKLDLIPQDLAAERAKPGFYGFHFVPAIVVVSLIVLMCLAIGFLKRRVPNGGMCYICGT